ncbi:MAG: universal stress protein [Dehalococcoidales bacterium]|nr:universal stress protein [Dehalococcoidales bacterium]
MYKKILIPLDGSELANVALDYSGGVISQMGGVELNLLHIYNPKESGLAAMHRAYIERLIETVNGRIEEMRQKTGMPVNIEGLSVRGESLMGHPVEVINKYISDNGIDLILMATHGRSG